MEKKNFGFVLLILGLLLLIFGIIRLNSATSQFKSMLGGGEVSLGIVLSICGGIAIAIGLILVLVISYEKDKPLI